MSAAQPVIRRRKQKKSGRVSKHRSVPFPRHTTPAVWLHVLVVFANVSGMCAAFRELELRSEPLDVRFVREFRQRLQFLFSSAEGGSRAIDWFVVPLASTATP